MGRKELEHIEPLTQEQFEQLVKVRNSPIELAKYVSVVHPIKGKVPFDLYPYQKSVLLNFMYYRFNIVLKFRQGGLTELICLYCLWLAMYFPNRNILILSIKDRVAKRVLKRIKFMYKSIPDYIKVRVANSKGNAIGTASELEFANGSVIVSIPTTEDAGRSEPASLVVIDEAAIIKNAGKIWASILPTLSTGGSGILNSTPFGTGNFYHQTWVQACSGSNGFNPIRLYRQMHPDYTDEWYEQMRRALGPRRTAQEIDGDFLTSGNTVFDLIDIKDIEESLGDYPNLDWKSNPKFKKLVPLGNSLRIYKYPLSGHKYFIGADISSGRSVDYSTCSIMDKNGEEFGSFRGKIPPKRMARVLYNLGKIYNNAVVAPESNDIGLSTAEKLQDMNYPNLYYSRKILKKKGDNKPVEDKIPGWYTTRSNRSLIISNLEEDVRLTNIIIKDPFFVQEGYTFIYDNNNRPVAMGKHSRTSSDDDDDSETFTDDTIMAKAITNHVRKGPRNSVIIAPR